MKTRLLAATAFAILLTAMPGTKAYAQAGGVDESRANTRAARREAEAKKHAATNQAPLYPQATRESPQQSGAKQLAKQMDALFKLQESEGNEDKIIAQTDAILANPNAMPFDKSSAAYLAGAAWQGKETGNYENASKYYKLAIQNNGLHNNNHYRAMLQLAQMLEADDHHAEALTMVDRFLAETKSDDANANTIRTQILLGMDKPAEAAAALEKALAAKPNDKKLMMNLAAIYMQANEDAKAGQMFDKMRAAGLLTEAKDYETGYRLLANIEGREKDGLALMEEGLTKGILTPDAGTYAFQGQVYYGQEKIPQAIAAWTKGAPLSKDGEMFLNVGKLQVGEDHFAEAKAAAKGALDKGVKKPGDAWQVIAQSEQGLGNKAGAMAAYREAAKYPETKKWAEASIRAAGGK
ncbi:tetratricopeptide repeat protein [soil metagenome]